MRITPRQLVYLYVALVVLEGPLRKWFLPAGLGPLVAISRDPIALLLLWQGFRRGLFRPNWLCKAWMLMTVLMAVGGLFSLFFTDLPFSVWAYGLRTNCLHFPLILIIPGLIEPRDLDRLLRRLLLLALPIALLMLWQYRSPIDSWINKSTLEGVAQIYAVEGKVRPPGPFSYITGAVEYFALINGYLFGGLFDKRLSIPWIVYGVSASLLAVSISGSRLMMASLALVWAGALLVFYLRDFRLPSLNLILGGCCVAMALLLALLFTPLGTTLGEGWSTTEERLQTANRADGGVLSRTLTSIQVPDSILWETPTFGRGLGLGTNFGAKAVSGDFGFQLAESETSRLVLESGLIVAGLFSLFRISLAIYIGSCAWSAIGRFSRLPIGLFFANLTTLVYGQITRPTSMGFVVLSMAFSLAASRFARLPDPESP